MKPKTLLGETTPFFLRCLMYTILLVCIKVSAQTSSQLPLQTKTSNGNKDGNQFANSKLTYKIINGSNKTFGYDIYIDGRKMIHQPSIPALPGNNGFKTKADAAKVAQHVIEKIKKGEMPPTVTIEEMKKINVIK